MIGTSQHQYVTVRNYSGVAPLAADTATLASISPDGALNTSGAETIFCAAHITPATETVDIEPLLYDEGIAKWVRGTKFTLADGQQVELKTGQALFYPRFDAIDALATRVLIRCRTAVVGPA